MAKGAHEKMLADLFREALNKDPETRSRSDIQIMSKLFGLCPQLKGIPRESMEKFCQVPYQRILFRFCYFIAGVYKIDFRSQSAECRKLAPLETHTQFCTLHAALQ
jgi:hypothetical protein